MYQSSLKCLIHLTIRKFYFKNCTVLLKYETDVQSLTKYIEQSNKIQQN